MADLLDRYKNMTQEWSIILYLPKSWVIFLAIFNWKIVSFLAIVCIASLVLTNDWFIHMVTIA